MKSSCDNWLATKPSAQGYPRVYFEGKRVTVHRLAFFKTNGYWPVICRHSCDNRICVNPDHLLDGSILDNVQDMVDRKRHARGQENGNSVLTESKVLAIRKDRESGLTFKILKDKYQVSFGCLYRVVKGQTWKHV